MAAPRQGGSNRVVVGAGLALAGGVGYYLYSAGGNPKIAEKQFEHDLSKLSTKTRDELPGREKEAKTAIQLHAKEAGAKLDSTLDAAREKTRELDARFEAARANAEKKLEHTAHDAREGFNNKVDQFDRTVGQKAAEAKGWFSGWFGSK